MNTMLQNLTAALAESPFAAGITAKLATATAAEKQAFVNSLISMSIKALVEAGMPVNVAFDEVLGAGQYQKLSDDVWTRCRAAA